MGVSDSAPRLRDRVEIRLGLAFWGTAGASAVLSGAAQTFLPYAAPVLLLIVGWPFARRRSWAGPALDWLPLPFVVLTYEMLHAVVPACWSGTIDPWLRGADLALLGADAGVLLEPLVSRPLTLLLACLYTSYYLLPVSLGVWWYRRNRTAFREVMMGGAGALFIGYLGYLFLPAVGPHAFLAPETFSVALDGDFIGAAIRSLNAGHAGDFPRDAFPSLHTANGVTAILVVWRHERRLLAIYGPCVAGIVAATVYLRFHYVVDVAAGALLAVIWQIAVVRLVARESAPAPRGLQSET